MFAHVCNPSSLPLHLHRLWVSAIGWHAPREGWGNCCSQAEIYNGMMLHVCLNYDSCVAKVAIRDELKRTGGDLEAARSMKGLHHLGIHLICNVISIWMLISYLLHIYIYIYLSTWFTYIYIYRYVCLYIYICMYVCMYLCLYCMYVYMYSMYICIY